MVVSVDVLYFIYNIVNYLCKCQGTVTLTEQAHLDEPVLNWLKMNGAYSITYGTYSNHKRCSLYYRMVQPISSYIYAYKGNYESNA